MRLRFFEVVALLLVALGAFAGIARALDFDEEDPEPPHAEVGMVYEYEIGSHAGCLPHHLVIDSGQLPPGLKLRQVNDHMSVVEGVATEAGTFSAWIELIDCANKSAQTLFTFDVWARRWAITTASLESAVLGSPYSATLAGAGPDSDVTWELTQGALPAGLTLAPNGTISGTPTAGGSSTFTVEATAKEKNFGPTRVDSKQFALNVLAPLAARVSRTTAEVKTHFRATLVPSGGQGPYTWAATGVPAGLAVGADGTISGVPKRAGTVTLTARLSDATGASSEIRVRLVVRAHIAIATNALRAASPGRPYRALLTARGGVEGKSWSVSGLPRGLRVGASTGAITGVAQSAGTFHVVVRVRDALGATARRALTLTVG
jgi:large repetitive protein